MTTGLLVVLAAVFGLLGVAKVAALGPMPERAAHLGFSVTQYRGIGMLELAGVAGLLLGRLWHPLALAAGIGLIALLIGAAVSHRTHGDSAKDVAVPLVIAGLVVVYLALLF